MAAKAWLDAWVPGWTCGQWASLAALIADREELVEKTIVHRDIKPEKAA
jgi:hypothetical protein